MLPWMAQKFLERVSRNSTFDEVLAILSYEPAFLNYVLCIIVCSLPEVLPRCVGLFHSIQAVAKVVSRWPGR